MFIPVSCALVAAENIRTNKGAGQRVTHDKRIICIRYSYVVPCTSNARMYEESSSRSVSHHNATVLNYTLVVIIAIAQQSRLVDIGYYACNCI